MRLVLRILFAVALAYSWIAACAQTSPLRLGARLDRAWVAAQKFERCFPGGVRPLNCFDYNDNGVKYTVAFDDKQLVTYLHTEDARFVTSDGLRVGEFVQVIGVDLKGYPGGEVRAAARPDGWEPVVGYDKLVELPGGTKLIWSPADKETRTVLITGFSKSAAAKSR